MGNEDQHRIQRQARESDGRVEAVDLDRLRPVDVVGDEQVQI